MTASSTLPGLATPRGTEAFALRTGGETHPSHFRKGAGGLLFSSVGLGTYLGDMDEATDRLSESAVFDAALGGLNHMDTASNYRAQRSERALGRALLRLDKEGVSRAGIVVATKGGYIPFDGDLPDNPEAWFERHFVRTGVARVGDVVGGSHVLTPSFIENQLFNSLGNLNLSCVDIYYVHNPEVQLLDISARAFERKIRSVFEILETQASWGRLNYYGVATWNGFRLPEGTAGHLSLPGLEAAARDVAGDSHRFRYVQLPFNLSMPEARIRKNQPGRAGPEYVLKTAADLGLHVVGSASLLQGRLAQEPVPLLRQAFPGLPSQAAQAIQFVRSTPGVLSALVGMKTPEHLKANLAVIKSPVASAETVEALFR